MKRLYFFLSIFCILFFSAENPPSFWDQKSDSELINDLLKTMTAEELLGQVFFLGYQGTSPPQSLFTWIRQRNLGGVKIFTAM